MTNPFQPCPGVASLTVSALSGSGQDTYQNVLHFAKNDLSNWSSSELTSLVNSFDTWIGGSSGTAALLTDLTNTVAIDNLTARDYSIDGGPEVTKSVNHVGADTHTELPTGIAFAFTLRTGLSGRSFRGRIFAYGLTHNWNGAGNRDQVDSTLAAAHATAWNNLITVSAGWTPALKWVVLSRRHKVGSTPNVVRANGIGTPITSVGYSNLVLDYMRRRAPFHARHN